MGPGLTTVVVTYDTVTAKDKNQITFGIEGKKKKKKERVQLSYKELEGYVRIIW